MQVVKKQGLIIKPIRYEDLDSHERGEEHRESGQKQRINRGKGRVKAVVAKSWWGEEDWPHFQLTMFSIGEDYCGSSVLDFV